MTRDRAGENYTASVEDYLKTIYEIEEASGTAATTDIANRLAVAPASVSGMVRRLAGQGLLEHERYRGVRLTDEGRRVALSTMRRHRILELYLVEELDYPWDLVHDEAERLEHAASDELRSEERRVGLEFRRVLFRSSVSGMVRRLAGQGLLEHERYRGVRLTDEGRRVALSTMRRHRILELYLVEELDYPWDLVHDEAERLEHAASDELIDRMAAVLGEPTLDPHGAPIPK